MIAITCNAVNLFDISRKPKIKRVYKMSVELIKINLLNNIHFLINLIFKRKWSLPYCLDIGEMA